MTPFTHVQRVRKLYKTILRLHRGLPKEMQELGSGYVRDEFRRHKSCNSSEANVFLNEWAGYAILLAEQVGLRGPHTAKKIGKNLKEGDLEKLREEQVYQLYELMLSTTNKKEKTDT